MSSRPKEKSGEPSIEGRVFAAILKAADALSQDAERLLKQHGLSGAQYNVLRILRGAEPDGLPCKGIGDRMISHDPDITRLLDRMEKRQMISRERQAQDRRVVKTRITAQGLEVLKKLDQPVRDLHSSQFRHVLQSRLRALEDLLQEVSGAATK